MIEFTRSRDRWAHDCPDCALILIHNGEAKVLETCGHFFESDLPPDLVEGTWTEADGLYVVEFTLQDVQWWTDYGMEYDTHVDPKSVEPISGEMWELFRDDEHVWPDEYYARTESWTDEGLTGLMQLCGKPPLRGETCGPDPLTRMRIDYDGTHNAASIRYSRPANRCAVEAPRCSGDVAQAECRTSPDAPLIAGGDAGRFAMCEGSNVRR